MKQKDNQTFKKKLSGPGYILNLKTGSRIKLIILIFVIVISAFIAVILKNIYDAEKKHKSELEQTIITASEQYINTSIENVVAIGKSIYTNINIYDFLNQKYDSALEYYDAFYEFENNNYFIIAENSNVKKCTVYTDNPTVLNGGNITNLSSAKNEKWYLQFQKLGKPMILFYNNETGNFSLIRKLDYHTLETGESYLKIDLNGNMIQEALSNLDFKGKIYIMSNGVLLYSNQPDAQTSEIIITPDYKCYTQNYYSADLEFFAYASEHSFLNVIIQNIALEIVFVVILAITAFILIFLTKDYVMRIKNPVRYYREHSSFSGMPEKYIGNDDLGQLYMCCVSLSDKLSLKQHEYNRCRDTLTRCINDTELLLMTALSLDCINYFIMNYPLEYRTYYDEVKDFMKCVPLNREFELLDTLKKISEEKYKKAVEIYIDKNIDSENLRILPCSLVPVAEHILKYSNAIKIYVKCCDGFLLFNVQTESSIPKSSIIKFHAIFEDDFNKDYSFKSGYEFNPCIRLKKYYQSDISEMISEQNQFSLTLTINTKALT